MAEYLAISQEIFATTLKNVIVINKHRLLLEYSQNNLNEVKLDGVVLY